MEIKRNIVLEIVNNSFMDKEIVLTIKFNSENNTFYFKEKNENDFRILDIFSIKDCYLLNKSVIDTISDYKLIKSTNELKVTKYDRLTNNLWSFLLSRIQNFIDSDYQNKNYINYDFYLVDNYCDIKKESKKYFRYEKEKYHKYLLNINTY